MLRAVGKYNRTEAPIVLQTARKALCLSEAAGEQVHAAVYDAQLALLLDDEKSSLSEDDMELLGELEGMLQVRGASAALRRRTEPLFQAMASDALTAAFSGAGKSAIATWGSLAVRQQELQLSTETAKAALICESRRLASEVLATAAALQEKGDTAKALDEVGKVVEYASFLGELLSVAGIGLAGVSSDGLAERYLGALTLPPEYEKASQDLAAAAAAAQPDSASLTSSLFAMSDPTLASARTEYAAALDATISAKDFNEGAAAKHTALAESLTISPALKQKLSIDAYYGWLLDSSERGDRKSLESVAIVRDTLRLDAPSVAELYSNTGIDELVITAVCELMLNDNKPLTNAQQQELAYLEGQLNARPGLAQSIGGKE